ncbi:hypothetical protein SAMN05192565_10362 [Methylobacterium gossipiicola]|uniref:Uncharacterized protein n=1 Tax=Methylobacterium gossipiicola TaxID=582675 RepID=A0A1I2RXW0_9HYPH|nr:hypothetical protein SAMN05192565_10362 [Methylobacterium gossipiicola]
MQNKSLVLWRMNEVIASQHEGIVRRTGGRFGERKYDSANG